MQISAAAQQDASILTSCWCLSVWRPSESPSGWQWLLWRKPGPRAWRRLPSALRRGPSASQWGQHLCRRSYKLWENHKKNHSLKTEDWKWAMMWEVQRLHIKHEYNNIIGGTVKPGSPPWCTWTPHLHEQTFIHISVFVGSFHCCWCQTKN